jgi:hypothetical protein
VDIAGTARDVARGVVGRALARDDRSARARAMTTMSSMRCVALDARECGD